MDGIAKPTPSFPPDSLSIWAVTPITSPAMFSSTPPEFPWLMAASVWIVLVIVKLFGAVMSRWRALTMPDVTVFASPNGLPIATTPSPTATLDESPSASGCRSEDGAFTLITAKSLEASVPTTVAL